jgi:pimeloyl-ACP methyl ester carboxylesterase
MANTILVPGTQATCLSDGTRVVYNAVRIGLPLIEEGIAGYPRDQWVQLMSMEHAPGQLAPVRTSLLPGVGLGPTTVVRSPYEPLGGQDMWPYDWRADLRWNAERLLAELRARRDRGDRPPNLVGHSQGGLLIVLASKVAGAEFAGLVRRVIFVGSPLAGTLKAAAALLFGRDDLGSGTALIGRAMSRTWPAIYQMLPAWPSVVDGQGAALPQAEQLLSPGGWPAGWNDGVTPDLLGRAAAVQAMLANPLEFMDPARVTTLMSRNQTTGISVRRDDAAPVEGRFTPNMQIRSGDTLVPFDLTQAWGGDAFRATVVQTGNQTRPHAELCCDNSVSAFIKSLL